MRQSKPSSKTTCLLTPEHIDLTASEFSIQVVMESQEPRSDGCAKQALIVDSMGIVVEGNVSEFRFVGRVPEQQVCLVGSSISQEEVSDHCHAFSNSASGSSQRGIT